MSFQQGLSGLNGAAKSLDVIGNNVANASTVGFKSSQAQFADVYANSLNGAGGNQAGIGSKVAQIAQQFSQGNIESTNNPLDIAINGGGFFRMSLNGTSQYSRNGQFELDKNGFLVNAQKAKLTGYIADAKGVVSTGTPQPIQINTADLQPVQTTKENIVMNLDSHHTTPAIAPFDATEPGSYNKTVPVDIFDSLGNAHVLQTYYVKTAPNTWDVYGGADGGEITKLQATANAAAMPFDNTGASADAIVLAAWGDGVSYQTAVDNANTAVANAQALYGGAPVTPAEVAVFTTANNLANAALTKATADQITYQNATTAGSPESIATAAAMTAPGATQASVAIAAAANVPAQKVGTVMFDPNGAIDTTAMRNYFYPPQTLPLSVTLPIYPATGATSPFTVQIGYLNTTQYGGSDPLKPASTITSNTQDGYTAGHLTRFSAGLDGTILGQYSNGQSHTLAVIVLANFADPNGLTPLGNNAWAESPSSGVPLVGIPNTGTLGVLQSSSVENSNVDLTAELVNMITAQRVYQANAQTIKTQDQVLQTLVNLR